VEGAERKIDAIIGGVFARAEGLLSLLTDANHGVQAGTDGYVFAERVLVAEQDFGSIVAGERRCARAGRLHHRSHMRPASIARLETSWICAVAPIRNAPETFWPLYLTLTSPTRNCSFTWRTSASAATTWGDCAAGECIFEGELLAGDSARWWA